MNTNHTPAPWQYLIADRGYIITNEDSSYDIAVVRNVAQRFDNEANARVMAASPDLLEAAMVIERAIKNNEPFTRQEHEKLKAAIAKATGEQA
jgi:hypothetical protein